VVYLLHQTKQIEIMENLSTEVTCTITAEEFISLIKAAQETEYNIFEGTTLVNDPGDVLSMLHEMKYPANKQIAKPTLSAEDIAQKLSDLDKYEAELVNSGDDDNSEEISFKKHDRFGDWIKVEDVKAIIEEIKTR
jgi:hypothetical protein